MEALMKHLRLGLLLALALCTAPINAMADRDSCPVPGVVGFTSEQLVVSTTALPLTATVYNVSGATPASMAIIYVGANAVRYRDDGLAPTTSVGRVAAAASFITVCNLGNLKLFSVIRDDAADATLDIGYYH